jgi:hypothetical protein
VKPISLIAVAALLLAGCASNNGRGLVGGQSTAADVEALMGVPAEKLKAADGDTLWFYPRQPSGRQMYAARIGPDGRMRSMEQTLTEQNIRNLVPGVTTIAQAHEILGPPGRISRFERQQRDLWEYTMINNQQWDYFLDVQFSYDGIVREVMMLKDYTKEMGSTKD